jgi:hypothetical protein
VYIVFLPLHGTRNVVETLPPTAPIIGVRDLPVIESEGRRGAGGKLLPSHRRPSSTFDLVVSECVCVEGIDWYVFPRDSAGCNKKYRAGGALGSLSALWTDLVYLTEAGAHPLRDLLRG